MKHSRQRAFTLVEIMIVVIILGILAAIVIPRFTDASDLARGSSLMSTLSIIRGQIQLYQTQHKGNLPTLAQLSANWGVMTGKTDVTGTIGAGNLYGPYLQQMPKNPLTDSTTVAATAAAGVGWVYDEATGTITACVPTAKATALGFPAGNVSKY